MSRTRAKSRMKVIPGGKQMSLIRDTEEVIKFLEFVGKESLLDKDLINKRIAACQYFFNVITEEEDHVDYLLSNLDTLLSRQESSEGRRELIKSSLEDYRSWSSDPFGWERKINQQVPDSLPRKNTKADKKKRVLELPIRADFSLEITLPEEGLSLEEFHRLGMFLFPYCKGIDFKDSPFRTKS